LSEAMALGPVHRPSRTPAGNEAAAPPPPLAPLEALALQILLRHPVCIDELPGAGEPLPFRDAVALALVEAWRDRLRSDPSGGDRAAWAQTLDPATAELAHDLLARADGGPELGEERARNALRVALLRLRVERLDEAMRDGQLLLEGAQREGDRERLEEIEQRINLLGREKAETTRAMHEPAMTAGARRT